MGASTGGGAEEEGALPRAVRLPDVVRGLLSDAKEIQVPGVRDADQVDLLALNRSISEVVRVLVPPPEGVLPASDRILRAPIDLRRAYAPGVQVRTGTKLNIWG